MTELARVLLLVLLILQERRGRNWGPAFVLGAGITSGHSAGGISCVGRAARAGRRPQGKGEKALMPPPGIGTRRAAPRITCPRWRPRPGNWPPSPAASRPSTGPCPRPGRRCGRATVRWAFIPPPHHFESSGGEVPRARGGDDLGEAGRVRPAGQPPAGVSLCASVLAARGSPRASGRWPGRPGATSWRRNQRPGPLRVPRAGSPDATPARPPRDR